MERLLSLKEVLRLVPFSARHLYRLEAAGKFPKRVKISTRKVAYRDSEIRKWLEAFEQCATREASRSSIIGVASPIANTVYAGGS